MRIISRWRTRMFSAPMRGQEQPNPVHWPGKCFTSYDARPRLLTQGPGPPAHRAHGRASQFGAQEHASLRYANTVESRLRRLPAGPRSMYQSL